MNNILHVATQKDWKKAKEDNIYKVESLSTQGFIHCSKPEQVIKVANFLFKGRIDLVLLSVDPNKVKPEIKYEARGGVKEDYPLQYFLHGSFFFHFLLLLLVLFH
ncbi:MAG TPA: DUF952 domain-containing protein [Candidatus Saccharimonadales bacterium]|nr:DUF952 domain-containing protein [Candidatus Saccharimonadales bacterium]